MTLDLYTRNIPLTQKARFWGNYVSALKGFDLVIAPSQYYYQFILQETQTFARGPSRG